MSVYSEQCLDEKHQIDALQMAVETLRRELQISEKANRALIGEIGELKAKIIELEGRCHRRWEQHRHTLDTSIKRGKQLEAIKMVLNGEMDVSDVEQPLVISRKMLRKVHP